MTLPVRLAREMGCTLTEFQRWLPGATRHAKMDNAANVHRVHADGGIVEITLTECAPRRIASIALPVLSVTFHFIDMSDAAREAFLTYFDRYTRRGGG